MAFARARRRLRRPRRGRLPRGRRWGALASVRAGARHARGRRRFRRARPRTASRPWSPRCDCGRRAEWRSGRRAGASPTTVAGSRSRIGSGLPPRDSGWLLAEGEEQAFREFFAAIDGARPDETVAWALERFEMGCERPSEARGAVRLPARPAGAARRHEPTRARPSMALRLAALCAEEGARARGAASPRGGACAGALRDGRRDRPAHGRRVPARARRRGGEPPARAAARRALRLPRRRPQGRGRRHPAGGHRGQAEIDARDLRKEPRFEREPAPAGEPAPPGEPEPYLDPDSNRTPTTSTSRRRTTRPSSTPSRTPPSWSRSAWRRSPCSTSSTA